MVFIYYCKACEDGNHGACELGHPAPKGHYGGSLCRCPCRGDEKWGKPEFIEEELKKLAASMGDMLKANKELKDKSTLEVNCLPKKIELLPPPKAT